MTTVTAKLPPDLTSKLAAEAKARRVSKSQIIRELLEKHFKASSKGKRRPSFFEMAGDLIGSVKGGPRRDLSTNPKYMKGYGD